MEKKKKYLDLKQIEEEYQTLYEEHESAKKIILKHEEAIQNLKLLKNKEMENQQTSERRRYSRN